jgi:exodeoxyribonuclease VII large subunit
LIQAQSVSELLNQVRNQLQKGFRHCWVRAEVAQLTASASGHLYFSLKDGQSLLNSVIWCSRRPFVDFTPSEGLNVLAQGTLTVYPPKGQLQFVVDQLIPDGVGQYFIALEKLRQKLSGEGLFESQRKRPLPFFPGRVGVVTSQEGAVWHDIQTTLERRNPCVRIILSPSPVQGSQVVRRIIAAMQLLLQEQVEVVILARGGGSWEDLMAFNSEALVRFLAQFPVPVIAAIGHETDTSLCDQVADRRAPTPTAAAEMVAPERSQLRQDLLQQRRQLHQGLRQRLQRQRELLEQLSQRPWRQNPQTMWERPREQLQQLSRGLSHGLQQRAQRERERWHQLQHQLHPALLTGRCRLHSEQLNQLRQRLDQALPRRLEQCRSQWSEQQQLLQSLSPQRVLERGYALCLDSRGQVVSGVSGRKEGDQLEICLADGRMNCTVEQVSPQPEETFRERNSRPQL